MPHLPSHHTFMRLPLYDKSVSMNGMGFKMLFMGKSFRSDDLNQALLLPPSLHDWLPEKHLARFLVDVV